MDTIISVKNLTKIFKIPKKSKDLSWWKKRLSWIYREWEEKIAVNNISFEVKRGEIIGYLGPNGAGKSTTIKMLTGILHPTSGTMNILGYNPIKDRIKYTEHIGVVFGQRSILEYNIPVKDSFRLFKAIYGLSKEFYEKRINYLIKLLDLEDIVERPYRMLSLGERMRCELAASFINQPQIVFLDEPTIGLDASAKISIRNFLRKINREEGVTVILTTHDMDDIEELCKRIILIDKGSIVYDGNLDTFKLMYSDWKRITLQYKKILNPEEFDKVITELNILEKKEHSITFKIPVEENVGKFLKKILDYIDLIDLKIKEPKLENIVAKLYEKSNEK